MTGDTTVSTGDIARLGGVGRAAVSNWRRRHGDFPAPVAGTASSPRFALSDVEAWLRRNGRSYRLSPADLAWQRLRPAGEDLQLPARLAAAGALLLTHVDVELVQRLPGRANDVSADPELHRTLDELATAIGPAAAFEQLCARHRGRTEVSAELAVAMTRIALPRTGTLLDPACGTGGLLLLAAPRRALGQSADLDTARIAAARLLLAGIDGEVHAGDALRTDAFADHTVDAVVCDAPGDRSRGHAELAGDPRFAHGLPPRTEPELAWLQHALAGVRPGGHVVVRMPGVVAGRRAGRRIRSNLLRAGALRAVVSVPEGDLWVLRRPLPDDAVPTTVLFGRVATDRAAGLWAEFAGNGAPEDGAVVDVVELLDDDVDLSPDRRLPRGFGPDPATAFAELRAAEVVSTAGVPELAAAASRRDLPSATLVELARSGALRVRPASSGLVIGEGGVVVLTLADLATGAEPTGRAKAGAALSRVRPGDVVAAPMGRVRVATTRAVLGPGLVAYRVDPDRLDPEFLAGVLRAAPAPSGPGSTRHGQRARIPLLALAEQRNYGMAFRELLEVADAARAAADRAEALLRMGGEGLVEGWLLPG